MEPPTPYGSTGAWHTPQAAHPQEREARRQAVAAAGVQHASPFVFAGTIFAGLVWEIPTADPHGYTLIFGFVGAVLLLLPALGLAIAALVLLRQSRRSGAVFLIATAGLALVESLGLATGFPGGIDEVTPIRVVTIAVGVIWSVVCALCMLAGVRALTRLSPRV